MRREDCLEMFQRIPEDLLPQVNLVLRNQFVLTVESVARFEPTYLVFRGREGGTSDEGRAFFVPYEEIGYIRIEREVRMGMLKKMYGETGYLDAEDRLNTPSVPAPEPIKTPVENPTPPPTPSVIAVNASDPASIAKQNLLDRIRAARANAGTSGKPVSGAK
jgi:hypothetical protein